MLQDFKDFVNKGNFVDIAVAFVIGAAFGTVVTSFTGRIVSPLMAYVFQVADLSNVGQFGAVDPATGAPAGSVGAFLSALLNFLIVALVMFGVVKAYNAFKQRTAEPASTQEAAESEDIVLLREIRDALVRA